MEVSWETGYSLSRGARDMWVAMPDQMLTYFGARVWARRHASHVIMGAYTEDEIAQDLELRSDRARDITPASDKPKGKLERLEEMVRDARTKGKKAAAVPELGDALTRMEAAEGQHDEQDGSEEHIQAFWQRESYEVEVPLRGSKNRDWQRFAGIIGFRVETAPDADGLAKLMADNRDTLQEFKVRSPALAGDIRTCYDQRKVQLAETDQE